jgi:transcription initiation factor TFIIIB Brf1 subunit/transcription initiation factor TFIIB
MDMRYKLFKTYEDKPCWQCGSTEPKNVEPISGGYEVLCDKCGAVIDEWNAPEPPRHPGYL